MIINPYRFASSLPPPAEFWGVTSFAVDGISYDSNFRWGWVFTLASDLDCNALRARTASNGVVERVILHRNSDSAVMATADIPMTSNNEWITQSVAPFTLLAGVAYTISGRKPDGTARSLQRGNTVGFDPLVTDNDPGYSVVITGDSDDRPTSRSVNGIRSFDFGYM